MNIRTGYSPFSGVSFQRISAGVASVTLLGSISGCSSALLPSGVTFTTNADTDSQMVLRADAPYPEDNAPEDSFNKQNAKKQVTILGMTGTKQKESIEQALLPFEQQTGIDII